MLRPRRQHSLSIPPGGAQLTISRLILRLPLLKRIVVMKPGRLNLFIAAYQLYQSVRDGMVARIRSSNKEP